MDSGYQKQKWPSCPPPPSLVNIYNHINLFIGAFIIAITLNFKASELRSFDPCEYFLAIITISICNVIFSFPSFCVFVSYRGFWRLTMIIVIVVMRIPLQTSESAGKHTSTDSHSWHTCGNCNFNNNSRNICFYVIFSDSSNSGSKSITFLHCQMKKQSETSVNSHTRPNIIFFLIRYFNKAQIDLLRIFSRFRHKSRFLF